MHVRREPTVGGRPGRVEVEGEPGGCGRPLHLEVGGRCDDDEAANRPVRPSTWRAAVRAKVVLPAPGVATARKSVPSLPRNRSSAAFCQGRRRTLLLNWAPLRRRRRAVSRGRTPMSVRLVHGTAESGTAADGPGRPNVCRPSRRGYRPTPLWGPSAPVIGGSYDGPGRQGSSPRSRSCRPCSPWPRAVRRRQRPGPAPTTLSGSSLDAYLTMVSRDLTGRSPTPAVRSSWTRQLAGGMSRDRLTDLVSRNDFAARPAGPLRLRPGADATADLGLVDDLAGATAGQHAGEHPGARALRVRRAVPTRSGRLRRRSSITSTRRSSADPPIRPVGPTSSGSSPPATPASGWSSTSGAPPRAPAAASTGSTRSLVGRAPTATWRARWTTMLTKVDDRVLAAALAASGEYVRRAPGRAGSLYLADQPLRVGTAGLAYVTSLRASGGTPPYRFSVTGLPAGLALQGSALTGTPQGPGSTFVSVTAAGRRRAGDSPAGGAVDHRTAPAASRPVRSGWPGRHRRAHPRRQRQLPVHPHRSDTHRVRPARQPRLAAPHGHRAAQRPVHRRRRRAARHGPRRSSGGVQQGAALQVRAGVDGRIRALTVTKNITWQSYWAFNFHTFDTARSIPFVGFGQIVLSRAFLDADNVAHLPWGMCARVRSGYLEFKAWPTAQAEPAWGDPLHGVGSGSRRAGTPPAGRGGTSGTSIRARPPATTP